MITESVSYILSEEKVEGSDLEQWSLNSFEHLLQQYTFEPAPLKICAIICSVCMHTT